MKSQNAWLLRWTLSALRIIARSREGERGCVVGKSALFADLSTLQLFDREGLASRQALLAAGVPAHAIRNDLRVGRYRRVYYGVYAIGPLSDRGRMVAALLAGGPGSGFCFASAVVVYELMKPRATLDVVVRAHRQDQPGLRFHRFSLSGKELVVRDGLRVTSIERTLLDLASIGVGHRPPGARGTGEAADDKGQTRRTAARHRGQRGAPALQAVATAPHTRSDFERRFLTFLNDNGLPLPDMNVDLGLYTADCVYEQHKLIIELDEHAHTSTWAFEADRQRDRHHATLGYTTIRVTERSLTKQLAAQLRVIVSP